MREFYITIIKTLKSIGEKSTLISIIMNESKFEILKMREQREGGRAKKQPLIMLSDAIIFDFICET